TDTPHPDFAFPSIVYFSTHTARYPVLLPSISCRLKGRMREGKDSLKVRGVGERQLRKEG
ncbi:MAG: hypothetical protein ACK559_21730, partial [bacterium]